MCFNYVLNISDSNVWVSATPIAFFACINTLSIYCVFFSDIVYSTGSTIGLLNGYTNNAIYSVLHIVEFWQIMMITFNKIYPV